MKIAVFHKNASNPNGHKEKHAKYDGSFGMLKKTTHAKNAKIPHLPVTTKAREKTLLLKTTVLCIKVPLQDSSATQRNRN